MKTKRLVSDALCAALYVVLANFAGLNLGAIKLSLDGLPVLVGALLFGPADGLVIGLLGNFISQLIGPYGLSATTVLWMLPAGFLGFAVGWYAKRPSFTPQAKQLAPLLLIALVLETTVTTGVMWVDCLVYHYSFVTYAPYIVWRYVADLIKAGVYTLLLPPVVKLLGKERT